MIGMLESPKRCFRGGENLNPFGGRWYKTFTGNIILHYALTFQ